MDKILKCLVLIAILGFFWVAFGAIWGSIILLASIYDYLKIPKNSTLE